MALATMTVTTTDPFMGSCSRDEFRQRFQVTCDWKSTDGGAVSKAICTCLNDGAPDMGPLPVRIKGKIKKVEFSPGLLGSPGTEPPSAAYDLTILDAYSYDVLDGNGANLSNTAAAIVEYDSPVEVESDLTVTIAAAGNETHGRIILWFE